MSDIYYDTKKKEIQYRSLTQGDYFRVGYVIYEVVENILNGLEGIIRYRDFSIGGFLAGEDSPIITQRYLIHERIKNGSRVYY